MNHLLTVIGAADPRAVIEANAEALDASRAFALNPTVVGGVPTAIVGPPDSGDHYEGELWTDALCASWRCTVAGTPGTWQQITPAFVATADRPVTPPDDYWIRDTDEHFTEYYWDDGGSAWVAV